jgi:hypothetical protein
VKDYASAAAVRGSALISVILTCEIEENIRRLTSPSRGVANTKLTDVGILRETRDTEDIYRFGGPLELEIDVTSKTAEVVAQDISSFLDLVED